MLMKIFLWIEIMNTFYFISVDNDTIFIIMKFIYVNMFFICSLFMLWLAGPTSFSTNMLETIVEKMPSLRYVLVGDASWKHVTVVSSSLLPQTCGNSGRLKEERISSASESR